MSTDQQNLYEVIGLPRDASQALIEQQCIRLGERCRPEKNLGDIRAAIMFAQIEKAYETLGDPVRRAAYDAELRNEAIAQGHTAVIGTVSAVANSASVLGNLGGGRIFCAKCGSESQDNSRYCQKCGHAFSTGTSQSAAESPTLPVVSSGAIWNPNAAANWSIIFSPAFGSYLQMLNWQSLGERERAATAQIWFYISLAMLVGNVLLFIADPKASDAAVGWLGILYLFTWYFGVGRSQSTFVKGKFGENYPRKSWGKPLLIGVTAFVGYVVFGGIVGFIVGEVPIDPFASDVIADTSQRGSYLDRFAEGAVKGAMLVVLGLLYLAVRAFIRKAKALGNKDHEIKDIQKLLCIGIIAIIIAMAVYPPFQVHLAGITRSVGYDWIFSPSFGGAASIDIAMLIAQWIIVLGIGAIAFILLRNRS